MTTRGTDREAPAVILWLRQDLRLADHPALGAALATGGPILPVYIWAPEEEGTWPPGAASRWWLHRSLRALDASLRQRGSRLILRRGPTAETLRDLLATTGARAVFWSRRFEPAAREQEHRVCRELSGSVLSRGASVPPTLQGFDGSLLHDPAEVRTLGGGPFQVFTPFYKSLLARLAVQRPLGVPKRIPAPGRWPRSLRLEEFGLEPTVDWAAGLRAEWAPGEDGALARLKTVLDQVAAPYAERRDRPDLPSTSRLSPHLHFGEISPRQIWSAVSRRAATDAEAGRVRGTEAFLRQVIWREFAHHLLYNFPHTTDRPLRPEFSRFPWRRSPRDLEAWQKGHTGYPVVDAGMRELWTTGWMHNRARLIAASFLVKDLLLTWKEGARWFWDTLVDADLANNTLGWQWTAGCGADAAPYFRIFNPTSQGMRFDPDGAYVRRWVPELSALPAEVIHRPWTAPATVRAKPGDAGGRIYPQPMVDHGMARDRALTALARIKKR